MSYSQANPPNVLNTVREKASQFYEQEKKALPGQVQQVKQWTDQAKHAAIAEFNQLERKEWLSDDEKKRLEYLTKQIREWTQQNKERLQRVIHPEQPVAAHSLSTHEQCHGPGRKNEIYGSETMRSVGKAHRRLRAEAEAEGEGQSARGRY